MKDQQAVMKAKAYTFKKTNDGEGYCGRFTAMASQCEVLIDCKSVEVAERIIDVVFKETKRIETKFSRYLKDNIVYQINRSHGQAIKVDHETAQLVDFAFSCYHISDGLFDISSGVLSQVWHFDGGENIPSNDQVASLLAFIGLHKIHWENGFLTLPQGMQLDFGGIGKEYAVDSALKKALQISNKVPLLLNFGGDLVCNGPRKNGQAWKIGIDSVGGGEPAVVTLAQGALATSGDANRYLLKEGRRYSHILNPLTGFPVLDAPRSITVSSQSCLEAGLLSTMAMLQGNQATDFLAQQQVQFWIQQ